MKKDTLVFGMIVPIVLALLISLVFGACPEAEQRDYFIVTFDKNGGDTDASPSIIRVYDPRDKGPWTVGTLPEPPIREGWIFDGWYPQKDGSGEEFLAYTPVVWDIKLYAHWVQGLVFVEKEGQLRYESFYNGEDAFEYINNAGEGDYTVKISCNQSLAPYILKSGTNITLKAVNVDGGTNSPASENLIITRSNTGDFFTVNGGAALTVGSGISLEGALRAGRGVNINANGNFFLDGGTINGFKSTGDGGGVYAAGHFTLESGTISGNTSEGASGGGGVFVLDSGSFSMNGGTIDGNFAANGCGVFNRGEFTLDGGTIIGNKISGASGDGGGVYNFLKFTLKSGTIIGNEAARGGGVFVYDGGTFEMEKGAIKGNFAASGHGVYNEGSFTMQDEAGIISGNKKNSSGDGGGVFNQGEFILKSGTISGNKEAVNGGGVYNWGNFTLNGGIISDNEAANHGGGVNSAVSGPFSGTFTMISGTISGNKADRGGGVASSWKFTLDSGVISGNEAAWGGGVYVYSGSFSKTGGIINGNDTIPEIDRNKAENNMGHAVYVDDPEKIRNSTVKAGEQLDSGSDEGWDT